MAKRGIWLLVILLTGSIALVWKNKPQGQVKGLVSPLVEITPTASVSAEMVIASPSATPTAEITAVITKKLTPKPTPTPSAESSEMVNNFIERFSSQYGVDRNVLRHMAICESGFRSNAVNGPYAGLFQFGETTWKNIRKMMGEETDPKLRFSAEEAVQTAAFAMSKGMSKIWPNCVP